MTIDNGCSFDVSDIKAIALACPGCDASLSLPPSDIKNDPPERCPNCGASWFPDYEIDRKMVHTFLATLRDIRKKSAGTMCKVRIQVILPS